jgi:hypothetical protein
MKCKCIIRFGDDHGDNEATFECQLPHGHDGQHANKGTLHKNAYLVTWDGDMREECEACGKPDRNTHICAECDKILCGECYSEERPLCNLCARIEKEGGDALEEVRAIVLKYFEDQNAEFPYAKRRLWMTLPNPMLGNISPEEMVLWGQVDKLLEFVKFQTTEFSVPEGKEPEEP